MKDFDENVKKERLIALVILLVLVGCGVLAHYHAHTKGKIKDINRLIEFRVNN